MKIHRVKSGESIFSIAKEYAVLPTKIIEANGLLNPDRLLVGQELLILTPTRTHTVRGGETLNSICHRFSVNESEILAKNPALRGEKTVYPGQILTIKSDTPPGGTAFSNGYYYNHASIESLVSVLPYLTYVTVCAARVERDDVKLLFDDSRAVKTIRDAKRSPLLHLFCDLGESRLDKTIVDTAILLAKARGYDGINLSMNGVSDYKAFSDFLHSLKATLIEYGLLLFVELDKNSDADIEDCYDGIILSYSKLFSKTRPPFDEGEKCIFTDFAEKHESSKGYIELSAFAYTDGEILALDEAMRLAHTGKCEIIYDSDTKLCHFDYNKYTMGKRIPKTVYFESLENIKAKLGLISELGYMGISFDVSRTPLNYLMMFDGMFRQGTCINPLY